MPTGCHRALTEIPNWTINVSTPWFIDPNAYNETHCRDRTLNTPGFNQYCARTDGQWWYGVNPYDLAPDNVYIPNRHGGLCLDAKRRRSNNSKVHMWPCDQTICRDESNNCALYQSRGFCAVGTTYYTYMQANCRLTCNYCQDQNKNQHWEYNALIGTIKSHDGICLSTVEPPRNGAEIKMEPCTWTNIHSQRMTWVYEANTYAIKNGWPSGNGYCLDARQRKMKGGKIHLWKCLINNKNQQWNMVKNANNQTHYQPRINYTKNIIEQGSWWGAYPFFKGGWQ